MAAVIHRTTLQLLQSVNTPDYPPEVWIVNPDVPTCAKKYWKIDGDKVIEMSKAEKAAVDAAALSAYKAERIAALAGEASAKLGYKTKAHKTAATAVEAAADQAAVDAVTLGGLGDTLFETREM